MCRAHHVSRIKVAHTALESKRHKLVPRYLEILLDPIRDQQNSQLSIVTKHKENAPTVIDWNEKWSRTLADKTITFGDVALRH